MVAILNSLENKLYRKKMRSGHSLIAQILPQTSIISLDPIPKQLAKKVLYICIGYQK
jgi:hypothetical protein